MSSLAYEVIGEDKRLPPVFCIHTVPLDSTYIVSSMKSISIDYQVVTVDLPGHGKSPDFDEDMDFRTMTQNINALREKLGFDKITILGHGVGGFVAQQFAITYPDSLNALILVNSAPNPKYRETMAWNIRENYSKVTIQALEEYKGKTDDKSIRARFTQSLATYFDPVNHDKAKELMDNANKIGSKAYVHISHYLIPKIDFRQQLRQIEAPVLILASSEDVWPSSASQLFRNDILHAEYTEFESGHFPMIEKSDKFWTRINQFLDKNR